MPHSDKYNIRGIAHVRTNRTDDIFMQRRLYIDEADTALDIFRFAVFFSIAPERTNSSLQTGLRSNGYSVPEKSIFQQRMVCWELFVFGLLTASEATDVSRVLQGCLLGVS